MNASQNRRRKERINKKRAHFAERLFHTAGWVSRETRQLITQDMNRSRYGVEGVIKFARHFCTWGWSKGEPIK